MQIEWLQPMGPDATWSSVFHYKKIPWGAVCVCVCVCVKAWNWILDWNQNLPKGKKEKLSRGSVHP